MSVPWCHVLRPVSVTCSSKCLSFQIQITLVLLPTAIKGLPVLIFSFNWDEEVARHFCNSCCHQDCGLNVKNIIPSFFCLYVYLSLVKLCSLLHFELDCLSFHMIDHPGAPMMDWAGRHRQILSWDKLELIWSHPYPWDKVKADVEFVILYCNVRPIIIVRRPLDPNSSLLVALIYSDKMADHCLVRRLLWIVDVIFNFSFCLCSGIIVNLGDSSVCVSSMYIGQWLNYSICYVLGFRAKLLAAQES